MCYNIVLEYFLLLFIMINTVTTQYMLNLVKNIPLFEGLNEDLHKGIVDNIKLEFFDKDHPLFVQGDPAEKMYIIRSGKVKIFFPDQPERGEIVLKDHDIFGEMALISNETRNASALIEEDAELFSLNKYDFDQLIQNDPNAANIISNKIVARMKENELN